MLLSVYVPVAVNCCVNPGATVAEAGVIAMESSAAGVTVSVVNPLTEPSVAVIVADPCATVVATPLKPLTP